MSALVDGLGDPPAEGLEEMACWRRPRWAAETSWDTASELQSELTVQVGPAEAEAVCVDSLYADLDAGQLSVLRKVFVRIWDVNAVRPDPELWGPFTVDQARALTEADLPDAKPGFAADAMSALAKVLSAIDESGERTFDQGTEAIKAAEAEAAATPTGPCPAWCELPDGHPFESNSYFCGEQFRYHTRTLDDWVSLSAGESYEDGVLQPIESMKLDIEADVTPASMDDVRDFLAVGARLQRVLNAMAGVRHFAKCPDGLPWCTDHALENDGKDSWHRRYVGDDGVTVCDEYGKFTLYPPSQLSDSGDISPEAARQAALDLLVAADLFEEVSS